MKPVVLVVVEHLPSHDHVVRNQTSQSNKLEPGTYVFLDPSN